MAETRSQPRDRTIVFSLAAAVLGAATVIVYLVLINSQADGMDPRVAFFASFIGLMAVFSLSGAVAAKRGNGISRTFLLAALMGNMAIGILGILSIGAPLVVAGALLLAVKPFSAGHPLRNLLPPALVLIVLALGIALTNQAY
jgi:hypothetical protein